MEHPIYFSPDDPALNYVATHVFLPVQVPEECDHTIRNNLSFARATCTAAYAYSAHIDNAFKPRWLLIEKMLDNLQASVQSGPLRNGDVASQLRAMQPGDILAFHIRVQRAAVIFRKRENHTLIESFEVEASRDTLLYTRGRLVYSYPGSTIEVPSDVFDDEHFQAELAHFLSRPGEVGSDLPDVPASHPQYVTTLLNGILRGVGHTVESPRIQKRVRHEIGQSEKKEDEWRRASLWLFIRVAIQTSLDRSSLGRTSYKCFVLFFLCGLAEDANNANLSSDLLHLICCKILRRLSKLGSSVPEWLSDMALNTCTRLQDTLDVRAIEIQSTISQPSYWNPFELDLVNDTRLSLSHCDEYIRSALVNHVEKPRDAPSPIQCYVRGTLTDFLSDPSFFDQAYNTDPYVALYDLEQSVEEHIDDWFAHVTDVDEASTQLGRLMEIYLSSASIPYVDNPEFRSIMVLTALELWVALDKLVVEEIPLLAEYSPEIPKGLLESLLLRKQMNLHRLSRIYQHLAARHSRSRAGLSVLSDEFTQDSFAVRFYDSSPTLQSFRARFEEGPTWEVPEGDGLSGGEAPRLAFTLRNGAECSKSLLHVPPSCVKVVIFELQCPLPLRIWRSCIGHLLYRFDNDRMKPFIIEHGSKSHNFLFDIPELQSFLVQHLRQESPTYSQFYLSYRPPQGLESDRSPRLSYAFRWNLPRHERSRWNGIGDGPLSQHRTYSTFFTNDCRTHLDDWKPVPKPLAAHVANTTHTSNEVLAAQIDCPRDFSLDEFIAIGHLRSGSSLQWVNILRELRGRILNLRSHEVHFLFAQAVCQVGPLDMDTGEWTWHMELQDSSFCDALLDELESLFFDLAVGSLDHVMMCTISALLARLLSVSPRENILERALQLLRDVRWKTLEWVQELAYNLILEPTNAERRESLHNMIAACRSTFDVDTTSLRKLFLSAQDVDALFSCAFFTKAISGECAYRGLKDPDCASCHSFVSNVLEHSELYHQRDRRLSITLEVLLKDIIQADASDRGVDLAIRNVWPGYRPGSKKWEPEHHRHSHILVCATAAVAERGTLPMHINLLDQSLLVDGRPLGGLPHEIRDHPLYKQIFRGQALVVTPSDLPDMDFATLAIISAHRIHFSLRGGDLVIRAQPQNADAILELIPPYKLSEDLPMFLVMEHAYWLSLSAMLVEIRPLERLWEQSLENWWIVVGTDGGYRMQKGHDSLVDMRSKTWTMLSDRLDCLDPPEDLIVTTLTSASETSSTIQARQLCVTLPHHRLSFFVNADGALESRDFANMIYDDNQCIGTLFGLTERLVLRAKHEVEDGLVARRILVPLDAFGYCDTHRERFSFDEITYCAYTVDTELGCLTGNSSPESQAFLVYLHAKTSIDWKPDPLTGRTGGQEALSILQSAGFRSIFKHNAFPEIFYQDILPWYPQMLIAHLPDIYSGDYWKAGSPGGKQRVARLIRSADRATHLFLPNPAAQSPPTDCYGSEDRATAELELGDIVRTTASIIFCRPIDSQACIQVPRWTEIWGNIMKEAATHPPSPYDGMMWDSNLPEILTMKVHDRLRESNDGPTLRKFHFLFLLPTVAYCSSHPQTAFLSMLLTFAENWPQHFRENLGCYSDYKLLDGCSPTDEVLRHLIHTSRYADRSWDGEQMKSIVDFVVECLFRAWPSNTPPAIPQHWQSEWSGLDVELTDIWDEARLTRTLQIYFSSCFRNLQLKEKLMYILQQSGTASPAVSWATNIEIIPSDYQCNSSPLTTPLPDASLQHTPECSTWPVRLDQLFFNRLAPILPVSATFKLPACNSRGGITTRSAYDPPALNRLYSSLRTNKTDLPFREQYITDLHTSALRARPEHQIITGTKTCPIERLGEHFRQCKTRCSEALHTLKESLSPTVNPLERALARSGQWPQITTLSLSRCLATTSVIKVSKNWRKCLVSFVLLLLGFQRSRRMLLFALEGLDEEFSMESENEGCDGWDAEEFPDWLLIQLQGNFLIRRTQVNIARQMITPQFGENTVMQVNMGEGKSSVIIPIVAAVLADGKQLIRVVVPRALMLQTYNTLIIRLGGLTNRRIDWFSISRGDLSYGSCFDLHKTLSECMEKRGIVIISPEEVLSLKLMGVETQLPQHELVAKPSSKLQSLCDCSIVVRHFEFSNGSYLANVLQGLLTATKETKDTSDVSRNNDHTNSIASRLLKLQKWLHSYTRDILDESDEILHPRLQLIYSVGHEQHMDGYPDRWTIIQQIMTLVKRHAQSLSMNLPDSVECKFREPGSFPYLHISPNSDAGRRLILSLLDDVMSDHLPSFRFRHFLQTQQDAIRHFLSSEDVQFDITREVEEYAKKSQQCNLWSGLLLLRGLFASNILLFALTERRWRVDYGLDLDRSRSREPPMLAVPYRAKDVPASHTQFGHPDITILLTCLSYYYTGLTQAQLRVSFQTLLDEDDPDAEYTHWVGDCGSASLPPSLRTVREFNLESSEQWDKYLYPIFSYNQATIDFYLSRVVFPKEAKEFPRKLGASSWDIAEKKERPTTGFSGTNDSRYLLPMSITQRDLDHQRGTNARVLGYLLQPENDSYALIAHEDGKLSKTRNFLKTLVNQLPEIRVLLDVGAQILDVSNRNLAEEWLDLSCPEIMGAIYVDDKGDEFKVLTRNRTSWPLAASPLSQQLDRCIIYLDDAHTRGTDFKFPKGFRAAVTLGPKVTKDRLVQGCMRMRKLGHGHSVMFFAPREVDWSIRSITNKEDTNIRITNADILRWAIHETLTDIQQRAPYWAQQGMSHRRRYNTWLRYSKNELGSGQLADAWLEPDTKTLAELYAPYEARSVSEPAWSLEKDISRRCKDLGATKQSNRTQLDEQLEREVNHEREREREVELPPKAEPARHSLHPDVISFVRTGILRTSRAFCPIFTALNHSSAATGRGGAHVWSPHILATADFCQTIKQIPPGGRMDQYIRPVQWVISGKKDRHRVLVVISPFEAHHLMPNIRISDHIHLHVYVPRTSERMKPADDLMFYSIPPVAKDWTPPWDLVDQLNIFAGQLYLRDYDSYLRLSHFLQLQRQSGEGRTKKPARYNLFNLRSRQELEKVHPDSLLPSIMMLLAIRRRGLPFSESHIGKILQGRSLTKADFKSATSTKFNRHPVSPDAEMGHSRSASPSDSDTDGDEDKSYVVVGRSQMA